MNKLNIIKKTYSTTYNKLNNYWVLWKDIETIRGICCVPIYRGNKKDVFYLKKILNCKISLYN